MDFTLIETDSALNQAYEHWKTASELAIDLECENNLHHYGVYITLIQIFDGKKHWILDMLRLKEVKKLVEIFENPLIQKIIHDVSFDLRILGTQLHCHPKNIFDTQMAAMLLGKKEIGLAALLKQYFSVQKQEKFQMADWTKRPLSADMLTYALGDVTYLIKLRDILMQELGEKGRLSWAEQEFEFIEQKEWKYEEGSFFDIKGIRHITDTQRSILKRLFLLREQLAKKVDRPVHFVISTKKLVEFACNPPDWKKLQGVHPTVRNQAQLFFDAVEKGKKELLSLPAITKKRYAPQQRDQFDKLTEKRDKIAEGLSMPKHLIANQDQLREIVLTGKFDGLREWQRELLNH